MVVQSGNEAQVQAEQASGVIGIYLRRSQCKLIKKMHNYTKKVHIMKEEVFTRRLINRDR